MMPKTDEWRANEKDRDEFSSISAFFSDEAAPIQVPQISNFLKFHLLSQQAPLILHRFRRFSTQLMKTTLRVANISKALFHKATFI